MWFLTILVLTYLLVTAYYGYQGYRDRTATDYLIAGRNIHPAVMALSYGSTFVSTSAIVGFGGVAAIYGMGILWLTFLNIFVGIFIAFVVFGARTRALGHRLDAHTFPELLGKRFDSKFLQIFAGAVILVFMPLYAAAVLMGATEFICARLSIGYGTALLTFAVVTALYVIMGGLKGVIYTDAFQGGVMLFGMLLLLIFTYGQFHGVLDAHRQLTDLAPVAIEKFGKGGHQGWTAMPVFGSKTWWVLISSIITGVGIGVLAQPQLVVRFMTVRSTRELNRAIWVGGLFILIVTGVPYVVGPLSNVLFLRDTGKVALDAAGGNVEGIMPLYITTYLPTWFNDLFLVTLLAAAMSTASSQFHTMGAAAGRDVYETSVGGKATRSILAARIGIFLTFLASVTLAYVLKMKFANTGTEIIARGTAIFFGLCAATFLPMYIGGLFTRAITKAAALTGGIAGFLGSGFWLLFMQEKASKSLLICKALFGVDCLPGTASTGPILWSQVDPVCVGLPLAIVLTIAVSLFSKKFSEDHLKRCFSR